MNRRNLGDVIGGGGVRASKKVVNHRFGTSPRTVLKIVQIIIYDRRMGLKEFIEEKSHKKYVDIYVCTFQSGYGNDK